MLRQLAHVNIACESMELLTRVEYSHEAEPRDLPLEAPADQ
ncbi:hypothetical protein SF83666_d69410 (plasmid) [Sinorhizobium fredii CCBAU 83666]|nr:hypothetical protein SF83666_d69410 [Sinorhizobium fredii CCBAU 83666]